MRLGILELGVGLIGLLLLAVVLLVVGLMFRDARRRGASGAVAALIAAIGFFTLPVGPLLYFVLALTGTLDGFLGGTGSDRPPPV